MSLKEFCDAASRGDLKRIEKILKEGKVGINGNHQYGNTALILASQNGHIEIVKSLLAKGANINEKNLYGITALIWAISEGHIEVVKSLLANGANVNEKDKYGTTALIEASSNGHIEIVKSLLANGANVNEKDKYGNTALIGASSFGHIEIVKSLLANGANPTISTNENHPHYPNKTARDIATSVNKKEIISLLENGERICEASIKCKEGQYEEAIEEYNKAIELEPMNALAYEHRGIAKANMGLYESAIEDFQTVLTIEHTYILE